MERCNALFLQYRSGDSHLDFDMDLARSQSNENPVYYVQYAHARICTMLNKQIKKDLITEETPEYSLLTSEKKEELLVKLGEFPRMIAEASFRSLHRIK